MMVFGFITYYLGLMLLFTGGLSVYFSLVFYFKGLIQFLEWEIFRINGSSFLITFLIDWIRLSFIGLVILISSLVLIYRTYYMSGDPHIVRFTFLVYLFVLSMIFLILSPNIIRILLGWDGLGLISYCLVIYYQNEKSNNAGIITILSNRVGDVAILLSISWLLNFGSWNFYYLQLIYAGDRALLFLGLIVILAAITKSAQMPFSAWLPAAIAAPTPVSALVHSSTLVTAGVYLLIRFSGILALNQFIFIVGMLTIFISGLGANFENDLKKIIALSTLSQLGLIIIVLGAGFMELAFFHLLTHAIFKSLLFLCAGVFIHGLGDIQDIRSIRNLYISYPVTSFYFFTSSLALCGFPFLSGFYSKDLILETYFIGHINSIYWGLIIASTIFTLTYSVRLFYYIFMGNSGFHSFLGAGEESGILAPITILFLFSLVGGCFISSFIFPPQLIYLPFLLKISVLIGLGFFAVIILYFISLTSLQVTQFSRLLENYLGTMWFLPFLSTRTFIPVLKIGGGLIKAVDHGWLELLGGQGLNKVSSRAASYVDLLNFSNLKNYIFIYFLGLILFTIMVIYSDSLNYKALHWSCDYRAPFWVNYKTFEDQLHNENVLFLLN